MYTEGRLVEVFWTSLGCFVFRSVSASYKESRNLKGIEVYRFTLQPNTLAAPFDNPDNECFCRDVKVSRYCTVAGALDISSCQGGQKWRQPRELSPTRNFSVLLPFWTYFTLCRPNRKTHIHLAAPLPSWQWCSARECAGPETHWGAPHDLPGCGTCKSHSLQFHSIKIQSARMHMNMHILFCICQPDNRVHLKLRQEDPGEHDVWAIKKSHVSVPLCLRNGLGLALLICHLDDAWIRLATQGEVEQCVCSECKATASRRLA